MTGHLMTDPAAIKVFTLAGLATLTLKSQRTGQHYTFKIKQAVDDDGQEKDMWFVSVLGDSDRYNYMGMIGRRSHDFFRTRASRISEDAGSYKAFLYFWDGIKRGVVAPQLEIRHEGHCGRCGRELTHPESIDSGIGPVCAGLVHAHA